MPRRAFRVGEDRQRVCGATARRCCAPTRRRAKTYPRRTAARPRPASCSRIPSWPGPIARSRQDGRDAFYKGDVAQRILATLAAARRHDDRRRPRRVREPSGSSRSRPPITAGRVYELPPNGQGIAALEMLNIMETFPLAEWGHNSVRALHLMIEAKKLAYADMLPLRRRSALRRRSRSRRLRSKAFAAQRAKLIDTAQGRIATSAPARRPMTDNGTTYLSVVDTDGNMVSLIQSNYSTVGFGAGLAVGGAGFVLQNRGGVFTLDAGQPERPRRPQAPAAHDHPRRSWRRATCASPSASWAAGTRRRRTRSSSRTSSTSA